MAHAGLHSPYPALHQPNQEGDTVTARVSTSMFAPTGRRRGTTRTPQRACSHTPPPCTPPGSTEPITCQVVHSIHPCCPRGSLLLQQLQATSSLAPRVAQACGAAES